jgi:uncharacterized protein (DUF1684 family)
MVRLSRSLVVAGLLGIAASLTAACSNRPPDDPKEYTAKLEAFRAAKDADFKNSDDPVPPDRKAAVLPLAYYPVNPDYHVSAALRELADKPSLKMLTSTGKMREMRKVGTLEFTLNGQLLSLGAYTETDLRTLFVPFRDLTSDVETYGSGRYLDLKRTGTGLYELDFNLAYNPYCYYNVSYECPIPPPDSRLQVRIEAGEKIKAH